MSKEKRDAFGMTQADYLDLAALSGLEDPLIADLRERRFRHHAPTPEQIPVFQEIRFMGLEFATFLAANCPRNGELMEAIRKIEEAVMWGNAAVGRGK